MTMLAVMTRRIEALPFGAVAPGLTPANLDATLAREQARPSLQPGLT